MFDYEQHKLSALIDLQSSKDGAINDASLTAAQPAASRKL